MIRSLREWLLDAPHRSLNYSHDGLRYRVGLIDGELPGAPEVAVGLGEDELEAECAAVGLIEADQVRVWLTERGEQALRERQA